MNAPRNQLLIGDALSRLKTLPSGSIDMVVTSPPYYRLRDYQAEGQLGLEAHVTGWVEAIRAVMGELHRSLTPTGSVWLNLGDSYATHTREGASRKSLLLGPERLALALIADGWTIRNKIVWQKTNPMPTSIPDRLAATWEVIYVCTKQPQYFFDLHAIRVPHTSRPPARRPDVVRPAREAWRGPNADSTSGLSVIKAAGMVGHPLGKNPGDVWQIATSGFRSSHHATYPVELARRAILAGCPEARCRGCRAPWQRPLIRRPEQTALRGELQSTCSCPPISEPGLVLDPFIGSGTTALAAEQLGRDWLGIELNADFAALATNRIAAARGRPTARAA